MIKKHYFWFIWVTVVILWFLIYTLESYMKEVIMEFAYKASFNVVFGSCFSLARHIFLSANMSQSEFSEEIGFNRRLLSKYELGTSNISYATYIYMWECLNVDREIADEILQIIIRELAQKGIYVYLSLDNISLTNNDEETLERIYVKKSYLYIQDWFGLTYDFDIKDKFHNLESINYKKLDEIIENIFRSNNFYQMKKEYRVNLRNKQIKKLQDELQALTLEYAHLSLDENFMPKNYDKSELLERDSLLNKMKEISSRIETLTPPRYRGMRVKSHPSGFSYNRDRKSSVDNIIWDEDTY